MRALAQHVDYVNDKQGLLRLLEPTQEAAKVCWRPSTHGKALTD
jgi:hypothetical protein